MDWVKTVKLACPSLGLPHLHLAPIAFPPEHLQVEFLAVGQCFYLFQEIAVVGYWEQLRALYDVLPVFADVHQRICSGCRYDDSHMLWFP